MRTYFYAPSTSTIASPRVVAPKATAPFIRLCGDYRQINPFICIPQEPIPHVQQDLAKATGWKFFVDLDMTNSFHQITLEFTPQRAEFTLALCLYTMGSVPTKISSRRRGSCLWHSTSYRSQNLCRSRRLDYCNLRQLSHSRRQL